MTLQILLQSFLLVAASEMGDKTQLLALILAARYKRPWAIMGGILAATLFNHGISSWAGSFIAGQVNPAILRYVLAGLFFAFALWILVPDKEEELKPSSNHGVFFTTLVTFFLAEMGDKTQLATLALGAKFDAPVWVTLGTTLGMLFSDGLAVFFGESLTNRISMKWIRIFSCFLFALFGLGILIKT